MKKKAKQSCINTGSPHYIKTSLYKDADIAVKYISLTDVQHLERTEKIWVQ